MTVVYLDSVFILNALVDLLLLLSTARLAGVSPRRGQYLLAAAFGGLYAAAAYLPGWGFLALPAVQCAAGTALALLAFGGEERLFRLTALFFAAACLFAGFALALGMLWGADPSSGKPLLGAALGVYLLTAGVFRTAARFRTEELLLPVRVRMLGRTAALTALRDSGNTLRDGGTPALVLAADALYPLLPRPLRALLSPERLRHPAELIAVLMDAAPELRPRLVSYHAVGTASGLLLTVESEWTEIDGVRYPGARLALTGGALGDGYQALWGGPTARSSPFPGKSSHKQETARQRETRYPPEAPRRQTERNGKRSWA